MTLLVAGYWHTTYWAENYWQQDYWLEYGTAVPPPAVVIGGGVITTKKRLLPISLDLLDMFQEYLQMKLGKKAK